jgi:hypothetical protein
MNKKPNMYGTTPIRVVYFPHSDQKHKLEEKFFSDASEAVEFVKANWVEGRETSARIQNGRYWDPIYLINETGEVFVSKQYEQVASNAPVYLGNIKYESERV